MCNEWHIWNGFVHIFNNSILNSRGWDWFVYAVSCSDWNCKAVNSSFCYEIFCFFRICKTFGVAMNHVFSSNNFSKFGFNCYISLVSVIYNLLCYCNIFFIRQSASVNHNACESCINCLFASFKWFAVVKVQNNLVWIVLAGCFNDCFYVIIAGIFSSTFRNCNDYRQILFSSNFCNGLSWFHIADIECWYSIAFF